MTEKREIVGQLAVRILGLQLQAVAQCWEARKAIQLESATLYLGWALQDAVAIARARGAAS